MLAPMSWRLVAPVAVLCLAACSGTAPTLPADAGRDRTRRADETVSSPDLLVADAALDVRDSRGDLPRPDAAPQGLPFVYTRPPVGNPVSATELAAATDKYIALLKQTRYFDVLDERLHGWPESDPQKRYWYGVWWGSVSIIKKGGQVTYVHDGTGDDNAALRTSPFLEGLCFAQKLWPGQKLEHATRRLIRGFNSWILSMERQANDPAGTLLARASYPQSVTSTDGGRTVLFDYSLEHPGKDNSAAEYVHIAQNPHWGDIWIQNKRSKDDIGHMLRAIATLEDCAGTFSADTLADKVAMRDNYVKWAKRVEADGWSIATLDKAGQLWIPPDLLAHFTLLGNAECDAMLAIRLLGQGTPGTFSCGNGIQLLAELIANQNDHNGEIFRSFHEAAVKNALLASQPAIAKAMLDGLVQRIEEGLTMAEAGTYPVYLEEESLASLIIHAANTGVPLTSREVRWLHAFIDKTYTSYVTNASPAIYKVFDPSTPDGTYPFTPEGPGFRFRKIGLPLGACAATYRNPASMPLLDCPRLLSTFQP